MGARLIAVAGPLLKMEFLLDEETVIGRDVAATVCIKSRSVSRRHCIVRRDGDQYVIRDLGSRNGTLINDLPVTKKDITGTITANPNTDLLWLQARTTSLAQPARFRFHRVQ